MVITERRLILLLPIAFFLTVASFLVSSAYGEITSRTIAVKASDIAEVAVPSVVHLARSRSSIRLLEVYLDEYVDAMANRTTSGASPEDDLARFREANDAFDSDWETYRAYPRYPGERELQATAIELRHRLQSSATELIPLAQRHQAVVSENLLEHQTKPLIHQLDQVLGNLVGLNTDLASRHASEIAATIASAHRGVIALDLLSTALAVCASILVVVITKRHLRALGVRMSELEHFAGRVAHDIRSPLASVSLALGLAERNGVEHERQRAMLGRASRTLQRVGQLVDGLLVFARAGARPSPDERADAREVVEGVVDELQLMAQDRDISLQVTLAEPGVIACSPGVLTSIVSNLVDNAVKYMGLSPVRQILVRVLDRGLVIRLEVEDTGPGVPDALRHRIFDPYVRGPSGDQGSVTGLGLGLSTVRMLVLAHHGTLGVATPESGRGSLFWVELPKVVAPATTSLAVAG